MLSAQLSHILGHLLAIKHGLLCCIEHSGYQLRDQIGLDLCVVHVG